jgi:hypothetical protein
MKRILSLLLVVCMMTVMIVGCNNTPEETTDTVDTTDTSATTTETTRENTTETTTEMVCLAEMAGGLSSYSHLSLDGAVMDLAVASAVDLVVIVAALWKLVLHRQM